MGAKSSPLAQQIGAHLAENMRTDTDAGAVRRPAWATVEQVPFLPSPLLLLFSPPSRRWATRCS
jgi:hypothetical protein